MFPNISQSQASRELPGRKIGDFFSVYSKDRLGLMDTFLSAPASIVLFLVPVLLPPPP